MTSSAYHPFWPLVGPFTPYKAGSLASCHEEQKKKPCSVNSPIYDVQVDYSLKQKCGNTKYVNFKSWFWFALSSSLSSLMQQLMETSNGVRQWDPSEWWWMLISLLSVISSKKWKRDKKVENRKQQERECKQTTHLYWKQMCSQF